MNTNASRICAVLSSHLQKLNAVLPRLETSGCLPLEVLITEQRVCIVIAPPPESSFIKGVMCRRETIAGITKYVYAAPFHGCLLKWEQAQEAIYQKAVQR